jgi:hypothetical protein
MLRMLDKSGASHDLGTDMARQAQGFGMCHMS